MKAVRPDENISVEECHNHVAHIRDALYVLSGKWKLPLIFTLNESPKRFGQLQRVLQGITPKTLTKELKELELNGFIIRQIYPTTPVTVIYESTDYSSTLHQVLQELRNWGAQHREKIKAGMRSKR